MTLQTRWRGPLLSCLLAAALVSTSTAAEDNKPGVAETMKKWQQQMTEKFRDTFDQRKESPFASADVREQKDSYTVRLHLPDRDLENVEITLRGDTLKIVAPASSKVGRYEQSIALSNLAPDAMPTIERKTKDRLIVITVPKNTADNDRSTASRSLDSNPTPLTSWEQDVFSRMEQMSRQMDRIFEDSFADFSRGTLSSNLFDVPRFGSTVDLQTEGDNYVARAYLPDRDMKNVNVTVEGQTLKIEARSEDVTKQQGESTTTTRKAEYAQMLTLPSPVEGDKMKVEKKEGMVVITIPKAKNQT